MSLLLLRLRLSKMVEELTFKNSKGDKLVGILSNPVDNTEVPVIVLCHGFSSNKDRPTYTSMEERLNRNSIATFRFDFYGHGESGGEFEDITISEAVNDTKRAIELMREKGYSNIGLLGSSFGGMVSLMVASQDSGLFALALKSPVSDYAEQKLKELGEDGIREWKERGYIDFDKSDGRFRLNYGFFEDIQNNNGYEAAEKIKVPTMIVHGDADETIPVKQSKKTAGIIENCRLELIEGAGHHYSESGDFDKCAGLLEGFIVEEVGKL